MGGSLFKEATFTHCQGILFHPTCSLCKCKLLHEMTQASHFPSSLEQSYLTNLFCTKSRLSLPGSDTCVEPCGSTDHAPGHKYVLPGKGHLLRLNNLVRTVFLKYINQAFAISGYKVQLQGCEHTDLTLHCPAWLGRPW